MRNLETFPEVLFFNGYVDFRKRRKSLASFVETVLNESPFSEKIFLFVNKKRDCIRLLYWDKTGFAMWEKELEKDKFCVKRIRDGKGVSLSPSQVNWLLDGVDIWKIKTHKCLTFSSLNI